MQLEKGLIKSCISKNKDAQKQLYLLLLPYLRAIANRYLRDPSYIKDVLQESFVKIFRSLDKYDYDKAPVKPWAAKITINHCINYNKRVIGIPSDEFIIGKHQKAVLPVVIQTLTDENLLFVLKKMPDGYFEVFNLCAIEGYSHKEIAKMLGISEALSRKRMSRGRNWVRKIFLEKPDWVKQLYL